MSGPTSYEGLKGASAAVGVAHDGATHSEWAWRRPSSEGAPRAYRLLAPERAERVCGMGEERGSPTISGWRVGGLIGQGGTCSVWRAVREGDQAKRQVALKVLHDPLESAPEILARLRREAELGRTLVHPHLVRVEEVTETTDGRVAIVQELVEGRNLEEHIASGVSASTLVKYVQQVARALEHLHSNRVVHRDVKPSNILIDRSGSARLADLGLAAVAVDYRITRTEQGLGSPAFAAPEQLQGRGHGPRSDIYSLGRVLQEGLRAIYGSDLSEAPPRLAGIVRRATRSDPSERYASAAELRHALDDPTLFEEVCPVGPGDTLGGRLQVVSRGRRLESIEPVVWQIMARDAANQEVWVALAADGPPGDWVRAAATRLRISCHREDGFVFAVIPKGAGKKAQKGIDLGSAATLGAGALTVGALSALAGGALAAALIGRKRPPGILESEEELQGQGPDGSAGVADVAPTAADHTRRFAKQAALRTAVGPLAPGLEALLAQLNKPEE